MTDTLKGFSVDTSKHFFLSESDALFDEFDSPVAMASSVIAKAEASSAESIVVERGQQKSPHPHRNTAKEAHQTKQPEGIGSVRLAGLIVFGLATVLSSLFVWNGYQAELAKTQPIETIQPGDRVVVNAPQAALDADYTSSQSLDIETIDPKVYRLLVIRAEDRWDDGTIDDINIKTLQPLEWIEANKLEVGRAVPLPLDLVEMGLPLHLQGRVLAIKPCPKIKDGRGRVVLTTVNHLNYDVVELTLRDANGREETLRPTGTHKFYSITRNEWLSASQLRNGEQLDGANGVVTVANLKQIPGTHRVYNMTVQGEHLYRVAKCGVLVHNNGCTEDIALGLRKHLYTFADDVDGAHFEQWQDLNLTQHPSYMLDKSFPEAARNARHIHFNLTDMTIRQAVTSTENGWILGGPFSNATNMEFRLIWTDANLLKKTTFYNNGEIWFRGTDILNGGIIPPAVF